MLASSLAEVSPPNRALDKAIIRWTTVTIKPGRRGEREVSRKTIACGNAGLVRWTCGDYLVCLFSSHTRLRVHRHPAFPTPSIFRAANGFVKTRANRAARSRTRI